MKDAVLPIEETSDHCRTSDEPPTSCWVKDLSARQPAHQPVLSYDFASYPYAGSQPNHIEADMSSTQVELWAANLKLAAANRTLMQMIAELDILRANEARYVERRDEPTAPAEVASSPTFPARALRFTAQRIGLFTPY